MTPLGFQVTVDGEPWTQTYDETLALISFDATRKHHRGQRIVLQRWFQPPLPQGHWINEIVVGPDGETVHDHRLTHLG